MSDTAADALLEGLDEQQRQAALALHGPVSILAGAGTGKTRAITHRIAYGVATGVFPPKRVMALTFTTRAAGELRGRLRALGADGVATRTFHSAALAQLNYFWPQVVGGGVPQVLETKLRTVADAAALLRLRLDASTVRDVATEIEFRKSSAMTFEQYFATGRTVAGLGAEQVLDLQRLYETLKDERRRIDFEDVLLATTGMILSEPRVAGEVHEQYRFFVVDEYQDVSPAQQRLLDAWLGERSDVCVVGDASQTIYTFAGANADFLLRFPARYGHATEIRLEHNYRSVPSIVQTANRLMANRRGALTLRAVVHDDRPGEGCVVRRFANEAEEAAGVAAAVRALLDQGVPANTIAVLSRVNGQTAALESALADARIPTATRGTKRFFEQPAIREAVMLLRGASVAGLDEPLFKTVSDVLREMGHTHRPPEGPGEQRTRWELLDALATIAEQTPPGTTLQSFVEDLAERAAQQHEPTMQSVALATLHAAKGLEWDHVFLVGLSEGLVPISYARTPEQIEEERRLLYVGITRARRRLHLSWALDGGRGLPRTPSRFLAELKLPDAAQASQHHRGHGTSMPGATSLAAR